MPLACMTHPEGPFRYQLNGEPVATAARDATFAQACAEAVTALAHWSVDPDGPSFAEVLDRHGVACARITLGLVDGGY